jgi:hypothetical protein
MHVKGKNTSPEIYETPNILRTNWNSTKILLFTGIVLYQRKQNQIFFVDIISGNKFIGCFQYTHKD